MKKIFKKPMICVILVSMYLMLCGYTYDDIGYGIPNPSYGVETRFIVPENDGFKSFMDYRKITSVRSAQYKVQHMDDIYTSDNGIRTLKGRYCLAIGTVFDAHVGQLFDIYLENGELIPCVVGDIKADKDTDINNVFSRNGCCSEFIVETENLPKKVQTSGNISNIKEEWESPVYCIDVYDIYIDEIE